MPSANTVDAPERIALRPGDSPVGSGSQEPVTRDASGAVSNIATPVWEIFAPEKPTGVAIFVAGDYSRIGLVKEALPAAFCLVAKGITAFVLTGRLPHEGWNAGPFATLQNGQRAARLIRANAARFGMDPKRIGVMGFSSGEQLCCMIAMRSDFRSYARLDTIDDLSAHPDFATLLYPVMSLEPPYDRSTARRSLMGETPSHDASEACSHQTCIRADCPTIFLVQVEVDAVISPEHSRLLDEACCEARVPVGYHSFASGGHGFGIGQSDTPVAVWPKLCRLWLASVSVMR